MALLSSSKPDLATVLDTARGYVIDGYREGKRDNTIFGKWYGMNNAPWCAMFVSYCFAKGKASKLIAATTSKGFASCSAGMDWFKKKKRLVSAQQALPGDVIFMSFDGDSRPDHVGICYKVDHKKGVIYTYEGNTSKTGSQDRGQGCFAKERPYKYVVGVGRPNWPTK